MTAGRPDVRRLRVLIALALLSGPLLLAPTGSATAAQPQVQQLLAVRAAPHLVQTPEQRETALRESEAAGDLEDSSAVVQAAGGALRLVAAQLPPARADVARARGELAGARAKAGAAQAAVVRAERALARARAETVAAGLRVDEGRAGVNRLARRTYQRGALSELRDVMSANDPGDVLVRAGLLRSVFRNRNDVLARLTTDRLALSRTRADVAAEERVLERARDDAALVADRARAVTVRAERAATRVADLVTKRQAALGVAETNRTQDQRDYRAAQAASKALAERIREAARRAAAAAAARARAAAVAAAAAERRRQAAHAAAAAAARKRNERPPRLAAPPRPAAPSRAGERTGDLRWPAPGRLTSRFGQRNHPIFGDSRFHAGIDIGGGLGGRVSAADGGLVIYAGYASGYGTLVVVTHGLVGGRDLTTAYAHMGQLDVVEGQLVGRGDRVGEIGSEGNSTGPHLHFEVRVDGDPVDPLGYVSPP